MDQHIFPLHFSWKTSWFDAGCIVSTSTTSHHHHTATRFITTPPIATSTTSTTSYHHHYQHRYHSLAALRQHHQTTSSMSKELANVLYEWSNKLVQAQLSFTPPPKSELMLPDFSAFTHFRFSISWNICGHTPVIFDSNQQVKENMQREETG